MLPRVPVQQVPYALARERAYFPQNGVGGLLVVIYYLVLLSSYLANRQNLAIITPTRVRNTLVSIGTVCNFNVNSNLALMLIVRPFH